MSTSRQESSSDGVGNRSSNDAPGSPPSGLHGANNSKAPPKKMKQLKLTVEVPQSKASGKQLFVGSEFADEDVMIGVKGIKISKDGGASSPAAEIHNHSWQGIADIDELQDTGEILGRGSAGLVKKVQRKGTNQLFALKVIPLDTTEEIRKKILLELKTLHNAYHDNIVTFYGAFYKEGSISICLELMDGGTLADIVKIAPIPEDVLSKITLKLLNGLFYIHKQLHLIHRDIKPQNILLNQKGEIKITDFGVSGKIENTIGKAVSFIGTVHYMSPERIHGGTYSTTSDIWSLGVTVLECALGYYPYQAPGESPTFFQLLENIAMKPAPLPPAGKFSPEFSSFISNCLQKQADARTDAAKLLSHPFIVKHATSPIDVASWVRQRIQQRLQHIQH